MKKALVILLALTMVLSCMAIVPFGASAEDELAVGAVAADYKPEGTAVSTAAEFAGMAADGTYYLAADITLDATYAANFTGTLDGNGKTITTNVPVFDQFNGTAMNLTLKGYIEINATTAWASSSNAKLTFAGAFANAAATTADVSITNVANYAAMTSEAVGLGGIVGIVSPKAAETTATFTGCANYGMIDKGLHLNVSAAGGIVGDAEAAATVDGIKLIDCANYGDVVAYGRIGGIIGVALCSAEIVDCYNEGFVQALDGSAGGIVGRVASHTAAYKDIVTVENCVNRGNITGEYYAEFALGGIVGFSGATDEFVIKNCVNYGNVYRQTNKKQNANLGGIFGTNSGGGNIGKFTVENCVNHGNIGVEADLTLNFSRAGGIVAALWEGSSAYYVNCYNYGKIYAQILAGGITSVPNAANSTTADVSIIGCGNYGYIRSQRVGGIAGQISGGFAYGPKFYYNINLGEVVGNHVYQGGLVGHAQNSGGAVFKYNIIGGKVTTTYGYTAITTATATVGQATPYTYTGANGAPRYFIAPAAGTVTITGDNVKFVATTAYPLTATLTDISGDIAVAQGGNYLFEVNGVKYCMFAPKAGTANIDVVDGVPTAEVDGVDANIIKWTLNADNKTIDSLATFDHPILSNAICWTNTLCPSGIETNVVLKGAADNFTRFGFGYKWAAMQMADTSNGVTLEELASGKVAYELNEAIGETVFYQNLNAQLFEVDAYPTTDATHAKVVNIGGVYSNQLFDVENDSGSPATGDAIVYVVVALAVSTISLAAVAVCKKIKEN